MRILMVNREDVYTVPGGDTIQMVQTMAALKKSGGVDVDVSTAAECSSINAYDLIHVINWEQLERVISKFNWEPRVGPPIVLSTVFWLQTGHWFDHSVSTSRLWKSIRKGFGERYSRSIYERWQMIKFQRSTEGERIRELLSLPEQLLPNSKIELSYLETVMNLKGQLAARSTVVPNGVRKELFESIPQPNPTFIQKYGVRDFVLQVGRIQSAKNQLALIQALAGLSVPIVFIGQPSPYETDYYSRCKEEGEKRGNVIFIEHLSQEELAGIYVLAAVHALPSFRETPGLVSLEAAAAGCRIVSTAVGSTYEYFGDDAWYCDPWNRQSIRQSVLRALNSPKSMKLRNRILQEFTWDNAAEATLRAYKIALGK